MAKTWATKCCSGTYKNNYQLCCGIKVDVAFVWLGGIMLWLWYWFGVQPSYMG